nr:hypothetical protein [Chroococcidiopsis sp. CCMEE 29]
MNGIDKTQLSMGKIEYLVLQNPCLMDGREFYSSLIRLHILHHAVQEPIFGLGIIEE